MTAKSVRFNQAVGILFFLLATGLTNSSESEGRFQSLMLEAEASMKAAQVPGLAIGIIDGDRRFSTGLGVTNVNHPMSVDANTLFPIASVTKIFTATAMMQLVETGVVQLDTPVTTVLPKFRVSDADATRQVTVGDLFQHRTGWQGDHFEDTGQGDDALEKTLLQLRYLPQRTPYGEVWTYNNVNYLIAGRVLEVLSGQRYEDLVTGALLTPLGMKESGFEVKTLMEQKLAVGHAASYGVGSVPLVASVPLFRAIYPAGGLRASVQDLMRFARFQMDGRDRDGERILSNKTLSVMQSPLVPGQLDEWSGIGWSVKEINGTKVISHSGRWIGTTAKLLLVPDREFAIAVLTNSDRGIEVYQHLIAKALKDFVGIEAEKHEPLAFDRSALSPFVGTFQGNNEDYRFYFKGEGMQVERIFKRPHEDAPLFEPLPAMTVALIGKDRIIITDGPNRGGIGELVRDLKGAPLYLRMQHRLFLRERNQ